MNEIKQVWGIIKDYMCADLKMVQDPALAVFQHQQGIIDDLKAQLNNMEACYIEVKKERDELQKTNINLEAGLRKNSKNKQKLLGKNIELQKRIDGALSRIDESKTLVDDPYDIVCDLEKALRGGHE